MMGYLNVRDICYQIYQLFALTCCISNHSPLNRFVGPNTLFILTQNTAYGTVRQPCHERQLSVIDRTKSCLIKRVVRYRKFPLNNRKKKMCLPMQLSLHCLFGKCIVDQIEIARSQPIHPETITKQKHFSSLLL